MPGNYLSFKPTIRIKTKRDFFSTLAGFLPGTLKNVPCLLNELLVNFREESGGIGLQNQPVPLDSSKIDQ